MAPFAVTDGSVCSSEPRAANLLDASRVRDRRDRGGCHAKREPDHLMLSTTSPTEGTTTAAVVSPGPPRQQALARPLGAPPSGSNVVRSRARLAGWLRTSPLPPSDDVWSGQRFGISTSLP